MSLQKSSAASPCTSVAAHAGHVTSDGSLEPSHGFEFVFDPAQAQSERNFPNSMNPYPAVDPIPLPAPVWLLKLLHVVTLSLHFVAVEMLLGGLLIAVLLSLFRGSPLSLVTARALARRLTVVMTFVINLAVPPLLFAQVLYGRALYTSSVLIGLYWISIIFILMLTYWL